MDAGYHDDLIRDVVGGKKIIVCADVLVGAFAQARALREMGARRPFLIAGSLGTGELPTERDADRFLFDLGGGSVMQVIRRFENALETPPPELLEALDRYDPTREALVIGTIFMRDDQHLHRRVYGGRRLEWELLEDKLVVDEVLDDARVARAPSEIVSAERDAIGRAHARLDRGAGTAVAGDTKDGWWGGAEYLRWIRSAGDLDEAARFFEQHCDRVRVMPFLDGIPCSVHGFVFDEAAIAFRPVEMLALRRSGSTESRGKLHYAGLDTYWDPPDADRDAMREAARRLGSHLRDRVGYRGVFTLDGVMTSDGFLPTEINARPGAGLSPQIAAAKIDIGFLSRMAAEHEPVDLRPADLESHVVARADARRGGACYSVFERTVDASTEHDVAIAGIDGKIVLGPSGVGGFVAFRPDPELVPRGASFAPVAAEAFAYTDEHFDTGIGPLEPAPDLRR